MKVAHLRVFDPSHDIEELYDLDSFIAVINRLFTS